MKNYINNKYKELDDLYKFFETIKAEINLSNENGNPSNWEEELELDELYLEFHRLQENIKNLQRFLYSIKKTKKYKKELIIKTDEFLYHPIRVCRLLEQGLISFDIPNSFDNL